MSETKSTEMTTPAATEIEPQRSPATWIATVGGIGYFPVAPGTLGSAAGIGIVALLEQLPLGSVARSALLGAVAAGVFLTGVKSAGIAEKVFGQKDPGKVVIDEVAGQMMVFLLRPHPSWKMLLGGFLLFRFFDVLKPFPARRAERLEGGWGIMVDDIIAGVYGMIAAALLGR